MLTSLMRIEKSDQKRVEIMQIERMNANKTSNELKNGQFELEGLISVLDELKELLGEILRVVDELKRAKINRCIRVFFALLLLASHGFQRSLSSLFTFLGLFTYSKAQ